LEAGGFGGRRIENSANGICADELYDANTITPRSATDPLKTFRSYIYVRKMMIRKATPDPEVHTVTCTLCLNPENRGRKAATGGYWPQADAEETSSGPQMKHLQRKHPEFPRAWEEEKVLIRDNHLDTKRQRTLEEEEREGTEWKRRRPGEPFNQEVFRKLLAFAIVSSNSAQTVVENEEWRDVFRYLEPEVEMVSRHTVHRDIMVLFNNKKTKVLQPSYHGDFVDA
jgi:hypothetical protein